jgi:DNA-binding transcriptional regulator YhcF (GntR family)
VDFFRTINNGHQNSDNPHWNPENIVEIEQKNLRAVVEQICKQCRYPLLALRLLLHVITGIDHNGRIDISARQLSRKMDVHYDTVTKCLKYLREIGVLRIER